MQLLVDGIDFLVSLFAGLLLFRNDGVVLGHSLHLCHFPLTSLNLPLLIVYFPLKRVDVFFTCKNRVVFRLYLDLFLLDLCLRRLRVFFQSGQFGLFLFDAFFGNVFLVFTFFLLCFQRLDISFQTFFFLLLLFQHLLALLFTGVTILLQVVYLSHKTDLAGIELSFLGFQADLLFLGFCQFLLGSEELSLLGTF